MKIDYGTLLSPSPIKLSIGSLKKHKLREIAEITFDKFNLYEAFTKMTPEKFFQIGNNGESTIWQSLTEDQREHVTMYDLIVKDEVVQSIYVNTFNFFFEEFVIFKDGVFILFAHEVDLSEKIPAKEIRGVINRELFPEVLSLIQQICCIYEEEENIDNMKFKNNAARKIMEKILKGQKEKRSQKKRDKNLDLPNIISAVSNFHPTITPITVWDLTLFQLFDSFNRLQLNSAYEIHARRVSVWGDEKKTFNDALWYKNEYEK